MAFSPQRGDVIVRCKYAVVFDLMEAEGQWIVGPFETASAAVARAHIEANGAAIWSQRVDHRGSALTPPELIVQRQRGAV